MTYSEEIALSFRTPPDFGLLNGGATVNKSRDRRAGMIALYVMRMKLRRWDQRLRRMS